MQKRMMVAVATAAFALTQVALDAQQTAGARQQYGPWQYNQQKGYHFRKYEYKANPTDKDYQHEYVIFFKADSRKRINNHWVYFYNPATEKFWGRYPTTNHPQYGKDAKAGKEVWSVLPAQQRQKDLYAIGQNQWPTPPASYCPPVPKCSDSALLLSPPSDLP